MPKLSQLADASVNAIRSKLGMGLTKNSLLLHYQTADGSDWSPALARGIAAGIRYFTLPEGDFTFSTPVDYVQGLVIEGAKEMKTSGVGGTRILANAGFLKNDNTTRKQVILRKLHIIGNSTASTVGIDGPAALTIEDCRIVGYPDLIRNLSGYLCIYRRNSFDVATRGINTADANGTLIEDNHFDASVLTQITTRDGTPQTGGNNGQPLIISRNNFNIADSTLVAVKVRGLVDISRNYFEDFGSSVIDKTFIDLEVNRFELMGAIIELNSVNGQGNGATFLKINGSHASLDNKCLGRVCHNYVIGCAHDVVYGTNNRIPGLKIYGHESLSIENSYRAQHIAEEEAWTYVRLGSDFVTSSATSVDVTGMGFTPDPDAQYVVEGLLMVRSAAGGSGTTGTAPQPGITWPTNVGDGVYYVQQAGGATSTVPRYGNTSATFSSGADAIADATGSWPIFLMSTFITPSNASGTFQLTLRSEVAATNVTMRAGSWIRYRRII